VDDDTTVVSEDGRTLTATHKGVNDGHEFTDVLVFETR
jgi:hypothetical protein